MDPFFKELQAISDTALSTIGGILNFNSTLQREESTRRNTPRPPQEEKHSTILRPQKPKASADEEESSASTRSEIPPSSEGAKTTRKKGGSYDAEPALTNRSGGSSSKSAKNQNYGSLRAERSLKEEEARTRADKSYLELNLDAPPPNTVIKLYPKSLVVPSGQAKTEKDNEERRINIEKTNAQLEKAAKKLGSEPPDKVYVGPKGPGRY